MAKRASAAGKSTERNELPEADTTLSEADLTTPLVQALEGDGHFEHAFDLLMAIDATQAGAYMGSELSRLLPPAAPERRA